MHEWFLANNFTYFTIFMCSFGSSSGRHWVQYRKNTYTSLRFVLPSVFPSSNLAQRYGIKTIIFHSHIFHYDCLITLLFISEEHLRQVAELSGVLNIPEDFLEPEFRERCERKNTDWFNAWRSLLQAYSTRMCYLYLDMGSIWCNKYFKYSYILAKIIICEDIMKITQIIVEI